jgi:hypothetical protein
MKMLADMTTKKVVLTILIELEISLTTQRTSFTQKIIKSKFKFYFIFFVLNESQMHDMYFKDDPNFGGDFLGYGKKDKLKEITFNDVGYFNQDQNYMANQMPHLGNFNAKIFNSLQILTWHR